MTTEIPAKSLPGLSWFFALLVLHAVAVAGIAVLPPILKLLAVLLLIALIACWFGFYTVQPNQGKVLQFFGR